MVKYIIEKVVGGLAQRKGHKMEDPRRPEENDQNIDESIENCTP